MASEVALALMLVVGAGLLATSLVRLYGSGAGFDPQGVVEYRVQHGQAGDGRASADAVVPQIGRGLSRLPGVKDVSFARIVPLLRKTGTRIFRAGQATQDIG